MTTRTMLHRVYQGSVEVSTEDNCLFVKLLCVRDLVTYESAAVSLAQRDQERPEATEAVSYGLAGARHVDEVWMDSDRSQHCCPCASPLGVMR
jgi:hypothetical protein